MYARLLHILIIATRLAASTAVVPAALVGGMLSFPTTCQCGADYPHIHPLNGIAGHYHDHGRTILAKPTHRHEAISAGTDGVTVDTATGTSSQSQTAVATTALNLTSLPRALGAADQMLCPNGLSLSPEIPPPQA